MKYAIQSLVFSALTISASSLQAYESHNGSGPYIGVALGFSSFDDSFNNDHYHDDYYYDHHHENTDSAFMTLAEIKVGYNINSFFAFEAQYGTGLSNDSYRDQDIAEDIAVKHVRSFYTKPQFSIKNFKIYALLGASSTDLELTDINLNQTEKRRLLFKEHGFSYGAGFSYRFADHLRFNLEVKELPTITGYELDDISFGLEVEF